MKKIILFASLIFSVMAVSAQTAPTSPTQLTTNTAYYEPSTHNRWYYSGGNGVTPFWWQVVDSVQLKRNITRAYARMDSINSLLSGRITGNTTNIAANATTIGLRKLIADSILSTGYQTVGNFFPKGDTRYYTKTIADGRYGTLTQQNTSVTNITTLQNRNINAGYGTLGGGNLTADRTISSDTASTTGLVSKSRLATNLTGYLRKTDTIKTPLLYSLTKGYGLIGFTFNNSGNATLIIDTGSVNSIVSKDRLTQTVALYYTKIASDSRYYPLSTNPSNYLANPMTTLGDFPYGGASGVPTRLAGNTTTAMKFLTQTGTGTVSAVPVYFDLFGTNNTWTAGQTFTQSINFQSNTFYAGIGIGPVWLTNSGANLNKLLAPTTTGAARTWTLQDKTGTVALTNDNISEFTNDAGYLTSSTGVTSITGTANQVIRSSATGAVTLSLPQSIGTSSTPTFGSLTLGGNLMLNATSTIVQLNNTNGTAQSWWIGQDVAGTGDGIWYLYNQTSSQFALKMTKTNNATFLGSVTATQFLLSALNTAPLTSTSTGTAGEIRFTAAAIYLCTATNTWVKAALITF